ncbi:methyltransferase-like protein 1 [Carex littledalei]|uniref:Methyltransferase-like protein 1 n=1 Tax=Carex littledalei TaxID=544730 RepID=A0A833R3R3_9POAL|nr:methyltransferase-like protein 1 [Carex littledalei]
MEALPEPSRRRSKREYEEGGESRAEYEDGPDRRRSRSSKSRKHGSSYFDEAEGPDEGRHRSSQMDDHDASRRESSSSYRRSLKDSRRSPEEEWDPPGGRVKERSKEREESSRRERTYDSRVAKLRSDVDKSKEQVRVEIEEARSDVAPPTERSGKYYGETEERERGYTDSDIERNAGPKDKETDEAYKGREMGGGWNERSRGEQECSREYLRNKSQGGRQDGPQEWMDNAGSGIGIQSRGGGYRKDSRGVRSESVKGGMSGFGNRNDSSDSIEIRPVRNLDFTRDGSDMDGNDGSADQRGRMQRAGMNSNQPGPGQGISSPLSSGPGAGPFGPNGGGRGVRGGRGRLNGRDITPQRMGMSNLQMPMMGPPFSPLGLPPGPIQLIGPNIGPNLGPNLSQPGPPIGPGVFIPNFPGPHVWPGGRGIDVNLLSGVPPNLPPIPPPVPGAPRFGSSVAPSPSHSLNQPGTGRTAQNMHGPGPMVTPNREMTPHEKPSNTWIPPRNSGGPMGKAPSRGEQNDYSQNFVDTGMRPQNFIRELELTSVVEDYPKLRELIQRKDEIVSNSASPPMYYKCDLREHALSPEFFGTKFDVILVDPPWEEYVHRAPGITDHIENWNVDEIMNLKIEAIADTPSFIFLWVGDGVGLEQGRACLKKWGFRRCEDICWVKTNKKNAGRGSLRHDSHTLFQHSKEHCLMGIKGTVRRSTDGHIIHANIDTDIIIAEEPSDGSTKKPEDMYRIIEHFALGKRRLELFGEDHNIRPGWLTLGRGLSSSNFNKEAYLKSFADKDGKVWQGGGGRNPPPEASHLVVTTPEIEALRPKSPPHKNQQQPMPPLGLGNSGNNRRNSTNSPQNSLAVMGSETNTPAHWNSSPMVGFGMTDAGMAGPEGGSMFDGFGFVMPFAKGGEGGSMFRSYS